MRSMIGTKPSIANKLIILTIIVGYVFLLFEIRVEHQAVLAKHLIAWVPIVYSAVMIPLGLISLVFWKTWGRSLLIWSFVLGMAVGCVGLWHHNEEDLKRRLGYLLSVWSTPTGVDSERHGDAHESEAPAESTSAHESDRMEGIQPPLLPADVCSTLIRWSRCHWSYRLLGRLPAGFV